MQAHSNILEVYELYCRMSFFPGAKQQQQEELKKVLKCHGERLSVLGILSVSSDEQSLRRLISRASSRAEFILFANVGLDLIVSYIEKKFYEYGRLEYLYARCGNIISALGADCNLDHGRLILIMSYNRRFSLALRYRILAELRRRIALDPTSSYLANVADRYLAGSLYSTADRDDCTLIRGFLVLHQDLIGNLTSAKLLQASSWDCWTELLFVGALHSLYSYCSSHQTEYVYALVHRFATGSSQSIRLLLALTTPIANRIDMEEDDITYGRRLILGKRRFIRAESSRPGMENESLEKLCGTITLYEERSIPLSTCRSCGERLTSNIFTDEQDSFGSYLCSQCADSISSRVSQVICPVCLDERQNMIVLDCGHACCDDCIANIALQAAEGKCPMCRTLITSEDRGIPIPANTAICRFLKEIQYP